MDFTREPIIETIITARDGNRLLVRSSKRAHEEYTVEAVEVVSFGQALFFRCLERPVCFLVPVCDYEVMEVKEARAVLKNASFEKIKIGGGKEVSIRKESKLKEEVEEEEESAVEERGEDEGGPQEFDRKKDHRHRRRRRGQEERKEESLEEGGVASSPPAPKEEKPLSSAAVFSGLIPPPTTLLSESIQKYKEMYGLNNTPPVSEEAAVEEEKEESKEEGGHESTPLNRVAASPQEASDFQPPSQGSSWMSFLT